MRIATEIGWGQKAGGARRVARQLLEESVKIRPDYEFLLYSGVEIESESLKSVKKIVNRKPTILPQAVWDQFVFPHFSVPVNNINEKPDVIHFTNNITSCWGSTPAVVTIHDMTPFVIPYSFHSAHGVYQRLYFKTAAKRSKIIVTVSEHSKKDICMCFRLFRKKSQV